MTVDPTLFSPILQFALGAGLVLGVALGAIASWLIDPGSQRTALLRSSDAVDTHENGQANDIHAARQDVFQSRADLAESERDRLGAYAAARRDLAEGLEVVVLSQVPSDAGVSIRTLASQIGPMVVDDIVHHLEGLDIVKRVTTGQGVLVVHRRPNVLTLPLRPPPIPDMPEGA